MSAASRQSIIVAVDGSARDADALSLGEQIADLLGAPVLVAHAHPYESVGDLLGDDEEERMLRSLAERVLDHAAAHLPGTKVTMRLLADRSPARALHRLADGEQAAMIVVGASERGRIGLVRPGSTAERIVQGSPCPVAVAPGGYAAGDAGALECIGCGFDGQPSAEAALAHASALAAAAQARLRILGVFQPIAFGHLVPSPASDLASVNQAARTTLARALDEAVAELVLDAESVLLDGNPGDVLAGQSESLDLLVVGSRGYGPLRSILLGGVSGHVIRTAHCPVLVCPTETSAPGSPRAIEAR